MWPSGMEFDGVIDYSEDYSKSGVILLTSGECDGVGEVVGSTVELEGVLAGVYGESLLSSTPLQTYTVLFRYQ